MVITVDLKANWKAGKKMPGAIMISKPIPDSCSKLTLMPGCSVFLHSGTFSVVQHNIMFSMTYTGCAEAAVLCYS